MFAESLCAISHSAHPPVTLAYVAIVLPVGAGFCGAMKGSIAASSSDMLFVRELML